MKRKAGIIVAMNLEYEALVKAGIRGVVHSGIGKVSAARAATEMILSEHPDCIINSGCAGGLQPGMKVFDLVIGARTAYHDVWCGQGNEIGEVQGLPRFFEADPELISMARLVEYDHKIHTGLICSGDQFLTTPEEMGGVLAKYPDALACDMESAAIAQVCHYYKVPFLSFRLISDVNSSTREERVNTYQGFWRDIADDSYNVLLRLIDSL